MYDTNSFLTRENLKWLGDSVHFFNPYRVYSRVNFENQMESYLRSYAAKT